MTNRIDQASVPLVAELSAHQRREWLEHCVDTERARDHARRLQALTPVPLQALISAAATPEQLAAELAQIEIIPVLTSHPSEIRPAAVLKALARTNDLTSTLQELRSVEHRIQHQRPSIAAEVDTLLGHFRRVLFDAIPAFYEELEAAAEARFGAQAPPIPTLLRFHSWVGADRDGNPACTAETTLRSAAQMHACVIERYRQDLALLAQASSGPSKTVFTTLRQRLTLIDGLAGISSQSFARELDQLVQQSHPLPGAQGLHRLARRYATFGFHLAGLEWRQHSEHILAGDRELHASLDALASIRQRYGQEAIAGVIISNCEGLPVILTLERFARAAGVFALGEIPVIPLFESLNALQHGPQIISELIAEPSFRAKLGRLNDRCEVMLGYSDAAKDGGRIAADILIAQTQASLLDCCTPFGIQVRIFHGRGGSVGRGAAGFAEAVAPGDPRQAPGYVKLTEQGEVVANRYGHPDFAAHTLRAWFAACLVSIRQHQQPPSNSAYLALRGELASWGSAAFRQLREAAHFMPALQALTQLDAIRALPLSSRPASRSGDESTTVELAALRAVPLNMAVNLAFAPMLAWYSTGTAFKSALQHYDLAFLQRAYEEDRLIRATLQHAATALAATNLTILHARCHTREQHDFYAELKREETSTRELVLAITHQPSLPLTPTPNQIALTTFLSTANRSQERENIALALAALAASLGVTG